MTDDHKPRLVSIPKPSPNADLIANLETVLKLARDGEITGALMLTQDTDGAVTYSVAGLTERMQVLGFLSHVMFRLNHD